MVSIAPMIDVSNHHFRTVVRLLTKRATMYTQMKSADAVIHNHKQLLPFHQSQHPIVLQLGGCEPLKLAQAARIGESYGYDGINLNVGCPSGKVQKGMFGAVLMKSPQIVKRCMEEMASSVAIPCSVKCRLGVDDEDSYQFLRHFISAVSRKDSGKPINHFVIHARKALLKGLNPSKNRTVPPLQYEKVFQLKRDLPDLSIEINGGIKSIQQGYSIMKKNNLDGFMVGRMAMENPFQLIRIDNIQSQDNRSQQTIRRQKLDVMVRYIAYIEQLQRGEVRDKFGNQIQMATMFTLVKPIINFYHGQRHAGTFRRHLSDLSKIKPANLTQIMRDLALRMAETQASVSLSQQL